MGEVAAAGGRAGAGRTNSGGVLRGAPDQPHALLCLEAGGFKLPRPEAGAASVELRASEPAMVLDGIDVTRLKRVPRCETPALK